MSNMVTLDVLLKGCLIIPYEEEIIAALSEVCKSYSNEHHSDDDVAGLAIAVFSKGPLDDLKSREKNQTSKMHNACHCNIHHRVNDRRGR